MAALEITVGVVAAGAVVTLIHRLAKRSHATSSGGGGRVKAQARPGWLVTFVNNTGVTPTSRPDLKGATAEWSGRAVGGLGRRGRKRGRRIWSAISKAAARSYVKREARWAASGGPQTLLRRVPRPKRSSAGPAPAASDEPAAAASASSQPPPAPVRHLTVVPDPPSGAPVSTTEAPTVLASPEIPADWALVAERVRSFVPEDDAALIAFMHGEAAAVLAYADGLEQARENAINDVGLDPQAVAGFVTYSEHASELAERMTEAYKTFVAVYGEVQQLAANGVIMPHNGRWFTGNTA